MILVTFHSVSSAMYLQTLLEERKTGCKIIPVPRALSSSCGYAAETGCTDTEGLLALCREMDIEWEAMYRPEGPDRYKLLCKEE